MSSIELIRLNVFSPIVLAFVLGIVCTMIHSDLKFPAEIYTIISIYLLFSLGLKGGVELSDTMIGSAVLPFAYTLALSILTPFIAYFFSKWIVKLDHPNSSAMAAHYGSVSIVTYLSAIAFLQTNKVSFEPYLTALVVVLEVPAIVIGLTIANVKNDQNRKLMEILPEILRGKSIVLLVGGLLIGWISGRVGIQKVAPFFIDPFQGVVTLFLLEMGMVASQKFKDLRKVGFKLILFGVLVPLVHGFLGVILGHYSGMSVGGSTILGTLAASASYIAAPAAVRVGIPTANPTYYLTSVLGITFPFNLVLGIPLYFQWATWMAK